ncbi:2-amino-4-hydroxy-6-hydroxymethyldihydropteridine diphosphokinase [Orlajensenia leifsoniae]|uniref:2-amino-4-hydroxy-6-hydroxymethyldihydropteridine diphosphokinase n=1 Tax=Orlajensenia leifsoniae TaxID=2561933 RepID=A0A4Y9R6I8_9MICO|nr:2-amino-4-hydroxy-6-hydroxymethyldihydropteridine diphosphokinase [Leifsonia flava]TFW00215.1 2-amino-4-hydroxy-6-hydroxymethyldihydropteridine diphosphokinase [Leifsonia flava]
MSAGPREGDASAETRSVLALGSNLGDRAEQIATAIAEIADTDGIRLTAASKLVESTAVKLTGTDDQAPRYLNAVVSIATTLDADALLHAINAIEADHGRTRDERWGDRTLDIDIITFGDVGSDDARLTLPHPRAAERAFVLAPWLEIEPDAVLPGLGRIDALLAALPPTDAVAVWPADSGWTTR